MINNEPVLWSIITYHKLVPFRSGFIFELLFAVSITASQSLELLCLIYLIRTYIFSHIRAILFIHVSFSSGIERSRTAELQIQIDVWLVG